MNNCKGFIDLEWVVYLRRAVLAVIFTLHKVQSLIFAYRILDTPNPLVVESMGDIIPRTSQLDPCVPVSVYTAPDVLSFRFCSCACNRGNSYELLLDYFSSSWRDFH
jgi:hypothetical protein